MNTIQYDTIEEFNVWNIRTTREINHSSHRQLIIIVADAWTSRSLASNDQRSVADVTVEMLKNIVTTSRPSLLAEH